MKRYRGFLGVLLLAALMSLDCASQARLKPPRVASDLPLDYPLSAQLKRIEGEVVLTVFVNPQGKAEQVNLSNSSGYDVLDEAAMSFVKKLDFNPGTLDDKPVSAWTRLVLRYRLTEQAFEQNRWLADVHNLQKEIAQASDSLARETVLKRLYTTYMGCVNYVEHNDDTVINSLIRNVIDKESEKQWSLFWSNYAAPFVLFDDFLNRYPESAITFQARQDLIRMLMDMETKIRMDALRSRRISRMANSYIELIEKRLAALQQGMLPIGE